MRFADLPSAPVRLAAGQANVLARETFSRDAAHLANARLTFLVVGWVTLAVASIWLRPLWPVDETRYVSVAWEMWRRGDFLVPYVNGEPYAHKPPLLFWVIHAGWAVFGVNEWWPRLVGPLCGIAAVPLLYRLEELLWPQFRPQRTAVWVLFGSLLFAIFFTLTMFDLLLMLCVMLAMVGVLQVAWGGRHRGFAWLALGLGLGIRFLGTWLVLTLAAFSCVSGKQAKYLVPLLPAFALLAEYALTASGVTVSRRGMGIPAMGFLLCAVLMLAVPWLPDGVGLPAWASGTPPWPAGVLVAIAGANLLVHHLDE